MLMLKENQYIQRKPKNSNFKLSAIVGFRQVYLIYRNKIEAMINPFMTEAVIKSMDWFLYDNGLRHERVKG